MSDLKDKAKAATSAAQYDINIYDDKMYALSIWNSTQMLFYNKDMLAAAGIELPSADPADRWTWEQTADGAGRAGGRQRVRLAARAGRGLLPAAAPHRVGRRRIGNLGRRDADARRDE